MILRCKKCEEGKGVYREKTLYKVKYKRLQCDNCSHVTKWYDTVNHDVDVIVEEWNSGRDKK